MLTLIRLLCKIVSGCQILKVHLSLLLLLLGGSLSIHLCVYLDNVRRILFLLWTLSLLKVSAKRTRPYNYILREAIFIFEIILIALVLLHIRPACAAHEYDIGELLFCEPASPVVQV